jgi:hypothetical protein
MKIREYRDSAWCLVLGAWCLVLGGADYLKESGACFFVSISAHFIEADES